MGREPLRIDDVPLVTERDLTNFIASEFLRQRVCDKVNELYQKRLEELFTLFDNEPPEDVA